MAVMMKVCELFERNGAGDNPYRYLAGWMNPEMRVVIMPNRDKRAASLAGALITGAALFLFLALMPAG